MNQIIDSLTRYAQEKTPTGGFLRSVLANDLMEACGRADDINRHRLVEICSYVCDHLPGNCHGSYAIVDKWLEKS